MLTSFILAWRILLENKPAQTGPYFIYTFEFAITLAVIVLQKLYIIAAG